MGITNEEPKELDQDVKDMVVLYRAMIDCMRGRTDINRYHRLEAKVNTAWDGLSREKQILCVAQLVEAGYMTEDMATMLTAFEGRIDMKAPVEPCYHITAEGR